MNNAYLQLLQAKGLNTTQPVITPKVQPLVNTAPIQPQQPIREQGFGTHFKETPPQFIAEVKEDNGIERIKKPKPKKKKKRKPRNKK